METQIKKKMKLFDKKEIKKLELKLSGELKNIMIYSLGMVKKSMPTAPGHTEENKRKKSNFERGSLIGRLSRFNPVLKAQQIFQGNEDASNYCFPNAEKQPRNRGSKRSGSLLALSKQEERLPKKSKFALDLRKNSSVEKTEISSPLLHRRTEFHRDSGSGSNDDNTPKIGLTAQVKSLRKSMFSTKKSGEDVTAEGYQSFMKEAVSKLVRSQSKVAVSREGSMRKKKRGSFTSEMNQKSNKYIMKKNLFNSFLSINDIDIKHREKVLAMIPPRYMTLYFEHSKPFRSTSTEEVLPLK